MRKRHLIAVLGSLVLAGLLPSLYVLARGRARVVTDARAASADCILVLGARVYEDGTPSPVLEDRLLTALQLYRDGRAPRIVVSGDHGAPEYDEVKSMADYLVARGVPESAVFLDHAGFDTYSSMYRAKHVFRAERVLVVTQAFHLPRALYTGERLGLRVEGVIADRRPYAGARYLEVRETASRTKAFADLLRGRRPRHVGPEIPLAGDGRATRG